MTDRPTPIRLINAWHDLPDVSHRALGPRRIEHVVEATPDNMAVLVDKINECATRLNELSEALLVAAELAEKVTRPRRGKRGNQSRR